MLESTPLFSSNPSRPFLRVSFDLSFFYIYISIFIVFFSQLKLYHAVIDDVIAGVRDSFLDEGVDEQVLQEMKQVWTNKLMASKAVELTIEPLEQQPPPIIANNTPKSKVCIDPLQELILFPSIWQLMNFLFSFQPNGTKSKKPSAQRENKNATNESNAQIAAAAAAAAANADSSSVTTASTTAPSQTAIDSNAKSNLAPIVNTQQQIVNKSNTSQPMQTIQSNAVHQVCTLFIFIAICFVGYACDV